MRLGMALRDLRIHAGLTIDEMAHESDLYGLHLSGVEDGSVDLSEAELVEYLEAIAAVLWRQMEANDGSE